MFNGGITQRFEKSKQEAYMMFNEKEDLMREQAVFALKDQMKYKFKDIKEDSISILKRISAYHNLSKEESAGQPHCKAINVKIFE